MYPFWIRFILLTQHYAAMRYWKSLLFLNLELWWEPKWYSSVWEEIVLQFTGFDVQFAHKQQGPHCECTLPFSKWWKEPTCWVQILSFFSVHRKTVDIENRAWTAGKETKNTPHIYFKGQEQHIWKAPSEIANTWRFLLHLVSYALKQKCLARKKTTFLTLSNTYYIN